MNEITASSSAPSGLPTLGDRPSSGITRSPAAPRTRRLGRKLIMGSVAGLLVLVGASSALATSAFNDTAGNSFAADIEWMASHGIADGFPDGGYHPTAPVTRQAMAAFMHRLNEQTVTVSGISIFVDESAFVRTATCPAGKRPIGGGGKTNASGVVVTDTYPNGLRGPSSTKPLPVQRPTAPRPRT